LAVEDLARLEGEADLVRPERAGAAVVEVEGSVPNHGMVMELGIAVAALEVQPRVGVQVIPQSSGAAFKLSSTPTFK
jgi:hypothetical protein